MKGEAVASKGRWRRRVLFLLGGVVIVGALYVWLVTVRTGHAYDGTPEEVVDAMLHDIRSDFEANDWARLGSYGVSTFLSWKNEESLREYVEEDLGNETLGPVDYVLKGAADDITPVGNEIHFKLRDLQSKTSCRVVLKKKLGLWHVKDLSQIGVADSS